MKRDMDLIREILLAVDAADEPPSFDDLISEDAPEADQKRYAYHVRMLTDQAGFLSGIDVESFDGPGWLDLNLTWRGHEFLDQIRDPEIWRKAKAGMEKAGGFSIDLIGALAKGLIKTQIEKHTGVDLDL